MSNVTEWSRPQMRSAVRAVLGLSAWVLAACPKVPTSTASMQATPNLDVSADQLQLQAFAMGHELNGTIASAADSIAGTTTDGRIRRRAMRWKLDATPLVQEAALRNDPLVAVVDLAAFTEQQTAYFSTGDGRDAFGPLQPVAVSASQRMQRDVVGMLQRNMKTGELSARSTEALAAWTAAHPITGSDFQRPSVLGADWRALGASDQTVTSTVASMDRTMRGLALRLGYLNESMSMQLRWNAQLLTDEMMNSPRADSMLRPGTSTIRALGDLAEGAPELIARERAAVLTGVDRERVLALADIDRQRIETLHALTGERLAITATLDTERVAVVAALSKERIAALHDVDSIAQLQIHHTEAMFTRLLWETVLGALLVVAAITAGRLYTMRQRPV
jgi:hypothetical protein